MIALPFRRAAFAAASTAVLIVFLGIVEHNGKLQGRRDAATRAR